MPTRTQYYAATSLDGFIATEDDSLDWLFQFGNVATSYPAFIEQVGAIAMGSTTYEWLLRNEVRPDGPNPKPWPYVQPAWVFTSQPRRRISGANLHFVSGDVRPVHEQMVAAAAGRNVWIVGGGELAGRFIDDGLLDDLIVQIASVTLGAGRRLLPRTLVTPPMKLVSATAFGSAFAELRYELARQAR